MPPIEPSSQLSEDKFINIARMCGGVALLTLAALFLSTSNFGARFVATVYCSGAGTCTAATSTDQNLVVMADPASVTSGQSATIKWEGLNVTDITPPVSCFGAANCGGSYQTLGSLNQLRGAESFTSGANSYVIAANQNAAGTVNIYKWITSGPVGAPCLGSVAACGTPYQTIATTTYDWKVVTIGGVQYFMGANSATSKGYVIVYKWTASCAGGGGLGNGTTCGVPYQTISYANGSPLNTTLQILTIPGETYPYLITGGGATSSVLYAWTPAGGSNCPTTNATGGWGSGAACASAAVPANYFQALAPNGVTQWKSFATGGYTYLVESDTAAATAPLYVYQWSTTNLSGCKVGTKGFGSGSVCGSAYQTFSLTGSAFGAHSGVAIRQSGSQTYVMYSGYTATGKWGINMYKWTSGGTCPANGGLGDGTTNCGAANTYQVFNFTIFVASVSNALEEFSVGSDSYLALYNGIVYKWVNGGASCGASGGWGGGTDCASVTTNNYFTTVASNGTTPYGWGLFTINTDAYLIALNSNSTTNAPVYKALFMPCYGDGSACGAADQIITGDSTSYNSMAWDKMNIGGTEYFAQSNNAGGYFKIYKWTTSGSPNPCIGDGATCGKAIQAIPSNQGRDGRFFTVGSSAYLAVGNYSGGVPIYKWNSGNVCPVSTETTSGLPVVTDTTWHQSLSLTGAADWNNYTSVGGDAWGTATDEGLWPSSNGGVMPINSTAHEIWFWNSIGSSDNATVYFRKHFTVPAGVTSLAITIGADDDYTAYLLGGPSGGAAYMDGQPPIAVGKGDNATTTIATGLVAGRDYVLAVKVVNSGSGPGGLLADIRTVGGPGFGDGTYCGGQYQYLDDGAHNPTTVFAFTIPGDTNPYLIAANDYDEPWIYKWTSSGANCPVGGGFGDGTTCNTYLQRIPPNEAVVPNDSGGASPRFLTFTTGGVTYLVQVSETYDRAFVYKWNPTGQGASKGCFADSSNACSTVSNFYQTLQMNGGYGRNLATSTDGITTNNLFLTTISSNSHNINASTQVDVFKWKSSCASFSNNPGFGNGNDCSAVTTGNYQSFLHSNSAGEFYDLDSFIANATSTLLLGASRGSFYNSNMDFYVWTYGTGAPCSTTGGWGDGSKCAINSPSGTTNNYFQHIAAPLNVNGLKPFDIGGTSFVVAGVQGTSDRLYQLSAPGAAVTPACSVYRHDSSGTSTVPNANLDSNLTGLSTGALTETTQYTLDCGTGYTPWVLVTVAASTPTVSITASTPTATEGSSPLNGTFTITPTIAPTTDTTVTFVMSGSGVRNTDYSLSGAGIVGAGGTTITLPANSVAPVTVTVAPRTNDLVNEGSKTAVMTLAAGSGYTVAVAPNNAATVTINDDEVNTYVPAITKDMLSVSSTRVRKNTNITVSWNVAGLMVAGSGGAGDTCSVTSQPAITVAGGIFPKSGLTGDASGNLVGATGNTVPITSTTIFTLTCTPPSGPSRSVSTTTAVIPSFQEI